MSAQAPRTVVLDDDPTGTQTVADLPIILTPDPQTLAAAAIRWAGPLWVLTNTRAMKWRDAAPHLTEIVRLVRTIFGSSVRLVLRGDSTLRGHVLGEIDTLSSPGSVALFVPAFVEQGRVTIQGVHYVTLGGATVEVATTEYARDPEFSYQTSDLVRWIAEREPGRPAFGMPLQALRSGGPSALTDLLLSVPDHSVVAPDVATVADLQAIRDAWIAAQKLGRPVVLRCASSMASVVTGSASKPIALGPAAGPVLVVCASYTSGATQQLAALDKLGGVARHEVDLAQAMSSYPFVSDYCRTLARDVADSLRVARVTVLSTPRDTSPDNLNFEAGEHIMNTVVGAVRRLRGQFAALVTKGGITSARIARDGLGVRIAYVRGQVLPGIPVWALDLPAGGAIDQVVIPGNVGHPTALSEIVSQLTGTPPAEQPVERQ